MFVKTKVTYMVESVFGEILQVLRKEKKLTQEELAFRSGLDRTYISLMERGLRVPTLATLFKLSRALNVEPEEVILLIKKKL